jgi:hypothetical protein
MLGRLAQQVDLIEQDAIGLLRAYGRGGLSGGGFRLIPSATQPRPFCARAA